MDSGEKKNILVVDDDREIVRAIALNLESEGYNVFKAYDGMEALDLAMTKDIHLILIDVMMPKLDGLSAIMKIRERKNLPIIVLSAKSEDSDKVIGLSMGADDYVTKPFSMRILLKKVYVILSRKSQEANIYDDGFLKVDFELGIVQQGVNECLLSPTEYRILKKLIENKGKLLTYSVLLDSLWDEGVQITDKHTLAVNINRLRKKIETEEHSYISNVYGMGYIWK